MDLCLKTIKKPGGVGGLESFWLCHSGRNLMSCVNIYLNYPSHGFCVWIMLFFACFSPVCLPFLVFRFWMDFVLNVFLYFSQVFFHLQEVGLLDKVHLKLLLWIVCVLRLFIKSENSSIDFYNNCSIFTVSVNCLSVDTFHNIRK